MEKQKVRKVELAGIAIAILALLGSFLIPEVRQLIGLESSHITESNSEDSSTDLVSPEVFEVEAATSKPFYVNAIEPILDKTIFIGKKNDDFIIGGRNLERIAIDVRGPNGEPLEIKEDVDYEFGRYLKVPYRRQPYFEIEYKGRMYAVEVKLGDALSPYFNLKPIESVTLQPMTAKELLGKD